MSVIGPGRYAIALLALLLLLLSTRSDSQNLAVAPLHIAPIGGGTTAVAPAEPAVPAVMFGVGDIGWCADLADTHATGRLMQDLLDRTPSSIGFTLGDNSNDTGTQSDYGCLDETPWATLAPKLFPVPGNHDYQADNIFPHYMLYFAQARGPEGQGYYSYEFGGWHVMALNSELMSKVESNRSRRQAQLDWIDQDLKAHATECTVAYFHRPPFSSGRFASPAWVMPLFQKLYKAGVDLVVTGHEHFFAAYPPLNPDGVIDEQRGIAMLTVGTGGAELFNDPVKRNYHEMLLAKVPGVVKISLSRGRYDWWFVDTQGRVPTFATGREVSGGGGCHG